MAYIGRFVAPRGNYAIEKERIYDMAKVCALTGTRPRSGNSVSHANNNKSKRRFKPNLITKRIWDPAKKRYVKMRITTRALKSLDKKAMGK